MSSDGDAGRIGYGTALYLTPFCTGPTFKHSPTLSQSFSCEFGGHSSAHDREPPTFASFL